MSNTLKNTVLIAAASFCLSTAAHAQFLDPNLPGLTQYDGWENLTITNPQIAGAGFPGFPGSAPWPEAIESDAAGSADATFDKTSGFGYPAGSSIYSSPFGNGTYNISDDTPLGSLDTIVFQIQIGSGSAGWLDSDPTLTINGSQTVSLFKDGTISNVFDPDGPFGAIDLAVLGYQWDVRGLGPITSFDIDFTTAGTSTTIYAMQLDQSSQFRGVAVPEPATSAGLILAGAITLFARRKRNKS